MKYIEPDYPKTERVLQSPFPNSAVYTDKVRIIHGYNIF